MRYIISILIVFIAFSASVAQDKKPVVVSGKVFTEGRILSEIIAQLIEARTDIPVEKRIGLGGTLIVFEAMKSGAVDIYPEYTGTGRTAILKKTDVSGDSLETFLEVNREFEKQFRITWLEPFGFSNSYGVAVRKETAEKYKLTRISDLAGKEDLFRFAWSVEFLNRGDGWPGLSKKYGLKAANVRGMEHGLAYQAIGDGKVDIIDAYTTDGKLLKYNLRILEDDKKFFPPYEGAPLIRMSTLERYPELKPLLAELAFKISAERMQKLNYEVEEEGKPYSDVARSFLVEEKLIGRDSKAAAGESIGGGSLSSFIVARMPVTLRLLGEHLLLTGIAVFFGILFAVPLGIWLTRNETWSGIVIGIAGIIQTVPSLALLAFMIPVPLLGLSMQSAIVALFLYSLLPIVRNTYTGIKEVDEDLIEAAKGMGLKRNELLRHVQLPLALPTIMAGLRTATVISIGVATLAAFIGAGGLGEPIITGLQLNEPRLIMAGAVPAAFLALAADWILGFVERRMVR